MKAFACLVRQTTTDWIVSIGDVQPLVLKAESTKPVDLAEGVLDYLERARPTFGDCSDRIVLCPESRAALFAYGPKPKGLKSRDRSQLKYHAESLLPLDAEKMAADFVLTNDELRVMAIDRDFWEPIVQAFSGCRLHFRAIAPASSLAMEEAMRSLTDWTKVVVWEEGATCDLWLIDDGGIARWTHLTTVGDDRLLAMRLFAAQTPGSRMWTVVNASDEMIDQLCRLESIDMKSIELDSQTTLAEEAANRICRGTIEPWFDLRDGTIAGGDRYRVLYGWMRAAAAAVAGLILTLSAACYWRSLQAERKIAILEANHVELFKAAFKDKSPPESDLIADRIGKLHREMKGSTNVKSDVQDVPSALELMHAALTALAGTNDVQASNFKIEKGELSVVLTFDMFEDVSTISDQFRKAGFKIGNLNPETISNGKKRVATVTGTLERFSKARL